MITSPSRLRLALAAASAALGLALTAFAPVSATTYPTLHVSITMFAFSPASTAAHLGTLVVWTNHDSVAHTTTSNQGFWSSPHLSTNASYAHRFTQAGTFAYHCAIHTDMHGRVTVPIHATPRTGGAVLTWALASGVYDVQVERPGSTTWVAYRTGTTARGATFVTSHVGRYHFRARTHRLSTVSGWSPAISVSVS